MEPRCRRRLWRSLVRATAGPALERALSARDTALGAPALDGDEMGVIGRLTFTASYIDSLHPLPTDERIVDALQRADELEWSVTGRAGGAPRAQPDDGLSR